MRCSQRLARAAWADLNCDPIETLLVPWAIEQTRKDASSPLVWRALQKLKGAPAVAPGAAGDAQAWGSLQQRSKDYAAHILAAPATAPAEAR